MLIVGKSEYARLWGVSETERAAARSRVVVAGRGRRAQVVATQPTITRLPLPCVHEGVVIVPCESCNGETRHVRDCEIHGTCTRGDADKDVDMVCARCPDYDPDGRLTRWRTYRLSRKPVGRRHLSYHIYPLVGSPWRERVRKLTRRWDLFDGVKAIAVAVGPETESVEAVAAELPGDASLILIEAVNDASLGETATWAVRWERILEVATNDDAVLYGHAKGVTRPPGVCQEWAELCHDLALGHWRETEQLLRRHPVVGSLLKHGNGFPPPSRGEYHYSGTFYWLRVGELRKRSWQTIAPTRWGVESWPSEQFDLSEAGVLFGEFPKDKSFGVYHGRETWDERVVPVYRRWLAARVAGGVPLDVVTPCTRPELLPKVRASVDGLAGFDVRHHVVDSPGGTWGCAERNVALDEITRDTWVYFLDDDNVVHPAFGAELRLATHQHPAAVGFVFAQTRKDGSFRLPARLATQVGQVDTAQFVFRRGAVAGVRWTPGKRCADFDFFAAVLAANPGRVVPVDRVAATYNALR